MILRQSKGMIAMHTHCHEQDALPERPGEPQDAAVILRIGGRLWRLILHNRLALAIVSLLWLIYRSAILASRSPPSMSGLSPRA
jgi:hypothetical protein